MKSSKTSNSFKTDLESFSRLYTPKPKQRLILVFLAEFGLGLSELTHLRVGDVNVSTRSIRIDSSVKSKHRNLKIPDSLWEECQKITRGRLAGEFLFPGRYGKQLQKRSVQKIFQMIQKKTGIPVTWTKLRKLALAEKINEGKDFYEIRDQFGFRHNKSLRRMVFHSANEETWELGRKINQFGSKKS